MLSGYRTYIISFLLAAATFAKSQGWIDEGLYTAIVGFLGAGGLASLRAGVAKK